jgi:hypothetical protein
VCERGDGRYGEVYVRHVSHVAFIHILSAFFGLFLLDTAAG